MGACAKSQNLTSQPADYNAALHRALGYGSPTPRAAAGVAAGAETTGTWHADQQVDAMSDEQVAAAMLQMDADGDGTVREDRRQAHVDQRSTQRRCGST
eukprot:SAG11_NODE_64_length_18817_cov_64.238327_15_plen_99_part_00